MKTILPFVLLVFLASCARTPRKDTKWEPAAPSKVTSAPRPSGTAEPQVPPSEPGTTTPTTANPAGAPVTAMAVTSNTWARVATNGPAPEPGMVTTMAAQPVPGQPPAPGAAAPGGPGVPPVNVPPNVAIPPGTREIAPRAAVPEETVVPANAIRFRGAPLEQVLQIYADYVNRNLLFPGNLNLQTQVTFVNQTPLTRSEVIQALKAVLALNGISMIDFEDKFVKVMPQGEVHTGGGRIDQRDPAEMEPLGQYITHVVQLRFLKTSEVLPAIQGFARIPASIIPIESSGMIVLRDYTENVKRMLEMINRIDVAVQSEYISEVIPIKYAQATDIADALNSLTGGGGGGGGAPAPQRQTRPGAVNRPGVTSPTGGFSPGGGYPQSQSPYGSSGTMPGVVTPGGAAGGANSFTANLQRIIQRASASGGLQIIGENKIIADPRSNSLLIFATRSDMDMIKNIISKLDVVLAQVLIETIIMDVQLNKGVSVGVSGAQVKTTPEGAKSGAGGYNNGQPLFDFVNFLFGVGTNATSFFPSSLAGGFTYWAQIGKSFDFALQAAASDDRVNVIQTPQILTSHATPGSIFVGNTVPYITTVNYGGSIYGGPSSSYQQLQVGIGLQVTPYINPDGLVVMQIDETIDELAGTTTIANVGEVPNTTSRRLSAEVAVRDGDSVMLGGFIRNSTEKKSSGIPILKDIPLLGILFSTRSSTKDRKELIVLMRPTVLKTPEIAASATAQEKKHLPGVSSAEAEVRIEEKLELDREGKSTRAMEKRLQKLEKNSQSSTNSWVPWY